jgi:hypothetical protein
MVSTVLDLTKFSMAMDQNLIVSEESKEAMFTPTVSSSGQALPNGLGWFVHEHDGRQLVSHYGHQPESYSSLILKVPEDDLTLILQASNADTSAPFNPREADVLKSPFARVHRPVRQWRIPVIVAPGQELHQHCCTWGWLTPRLLLLCQE